MAKTKSKTTGLPVPAKRDPNARKYRSRSERNAYNNRLALIASGGLGAVIILILVSALIIEGVILPNKAVASVNGQTISTTAFQKRVVYERWQAGQVLGAMLNQYGQYAQQILSDTQNQYGQLYQQLSQPTAMGQKVLDDMVNDILIKQYADANNIKVNDDDINKQLGTSFGYNPNPQTSTPTVTPSLTPSPLVSSTPTATPTITPVPSQTVTPTSTAIPTGIPTITPGPTDQKATFDKNLSTFYDRAAKATGLTQDELKQIFVADALRQKVTEAIAGKPQNQQQEVKARHILLDATKTSEASEILTALQNGASFANLARADSTDTSNRDKGGELGWAPKGQYVPEFEAAVWNDQTKIGAVVGPIKTQFGLHIIQIEGREVRTLTDAEAQQVQSKTFQDWLTKQGSDTAKVQKFDNWYDVVPSRPNLQDLGLPDLTQQGSGIPGLPGGLPGQ